jgi:hypothetical protein
MVKKVTTGKGRNRPGARKPALTAKRRASAMMRADEFISGLGIGRNQGYEALEQGRVEGAFRWGRTWFIPRATYHKLTGGGSTASTTPPGPLAPALPAPEPHSKPSACAVRPARRTTHKPKPAREPAITT